MKFFVAFLAVCALAAAGPVHKPNDATNAELEAIIAAIQSPSTDPGTAALLEQQLQDILDSLKPEVAPIEVGPAIVDQFEPISVGPAIVDESVVAGPAAVEEAAPAPAPAPATPLVQIIVNVASSGISASPVAVEESPAVIDRPIPAQTPEEPAIVPEPVVVAPEVIVPEPVVIAPEPAIVPEPVIVAPIFPEPALAPEELN